MLPGLGVILMFPRLVCSQPGESGALHCTALSLLHCWMLQMLPGVDNQEFDTVGLCLEAVINLHKVMGGWEGVRW